MPPLADPDDRKGGLLAWQWTMYPTGHTTRTNLLIHALTVPVFQLGTLVLLGGTALGGRVALVGVAMMAGAMAGQGRGHARGPGDVLVRIMGEQWIAFPRFVWTGGFTHAWRAPR